MEGTEGREGGRQAGRRKAMEKNDGKGQKEGWKITDHIALYLRVVSVLRFFVQVQQ